MTTRSRFPRRLSRGSSRRFPRLKFEWGTFSFAATVAAGALSKMDLTLLMRPGERGLTCVRIIANLWMEPIGTGNIDWSFGIGRAENDAYDAGILPTLLSTNNDGYNWMYQTIQTHTSPDSVVNSTQFGVDVRARRRLGPDFKLFGQYQNYSSSASSVVFDFSGRALYIVN